MAGKLLNKTLGIYAVYALLVLILSSFLFYYLLKTLYLEEISEELYVKEEVFRETQLPDLKITDIATWNKYNVNQKILNYSIPLTESEIQEIWIFDPYLGEPVPYLQLKSTIKIEKRNFILKTRISMVETEDLVENIFILFSIVISAFLAGFFLLTKIISTRVWKPFKQTLKHIKSFEIDRNADFKFPESGIKEFRELNGSFEKLIQNNLKIYQKQKEFVENAAHELQTPLAIIQNQYTLLIQDQDLTTDQAEIIQKMSLTISRLNRLNKNLLFLSKLDKVTFPATEINFSELLKNHLELFEDQAETHQTTITSKISPDCYIKTNQTLLESILDNLVSNAIRYNLPGGKIEVRLHGQELKISNTSEVQKLNTETIFIRFQKSVSAQEGNGLGLSIVKKITELNEWDIDYFFENGLHEFKIRF